MAESTKSTWEEITSSVSSFVKGLFTRRDPYDIVQYIPQFFEDEHNPFEKRIAFIEANKNQIFQDLSSTLKKHNPEIPPITEEQFNAMIQYYIPERIKEGDVIKVKDGEITYAELQKAVLDADNVSKNDGRFGEKMPKIFVMPELPTEYYARKEVLESAYYNNTNVMYIPPIDTILIDRDFFSEISSKQAKSVITHEAGHGIDYRTRGYAEAEYNASKHISSLFLGDDKFLDACAKQLVSGDQENISTECKNTLEIIENHKKKNVNPAIERKNIELAHDMEERADLYAALASPEYAKELINIFKDKNALGSATHPSTIQRADYIGQVLANPAYYKQQLEKDIAEFKQFASQPTNSDSAANKIPATPPTQSAVQNTARSNN